LFYFLFIVFSSTKIIVLDKEGIFRINSSSQNIVRAVEMLDQTSSIEFSQFPDDEYLPCSLLKKYFRELPEPLLGPKIMNCFEAIGQSMSKKIKEFVKT
jgi:hypothetical protein